MSIEKLRKELGELEAMLARIPVASCDADDRSARGIYEHLIADTRWNLFRLTAPVSDVTPG